MRNLLWLFALLPSLIVVVASQANAQVAEFGFCEYLINKGDAQSAVRVLQNYPYTENSPYNDSLNYLKGWAAYNTKSLDSSAFYLLRVSTNSVFSTKAKLFAAYCHLHLGQYSQAQDILLAPSPILTRDTLVYNYLGAGLALLKRNLPEYEHYRKTLPSDYYGFASELQRLDQWSNELKTKKHKSVWLAGLLSAVLPGSGKAYLGKTGQGVSSFLMVAGLGAVTWENYRKRGLENVQTILYGTLFASFYLGNVYGTVKLAPVVNQETNDEYNAKVLFNLHIPIRNLYN